MRKILKSTLLLITLLFFIYCSFSDTVITHNFDNGWKNKESVDFEFKKSSNENNYDLYLILRHNKNYSFSNIFIISKLKLLNEDEKIDTLEYILSEPNGKWKGKTKLSIVEHKLNFKKNINLNGDGFNYLSLRNAMRLNNTISPIQNLENVIDLGLLIEPVK